MRSGGSPPAGLGSDCQGLLQAKTSCTDPAAPPVSEGPGMGRQLHKLLPERTVRALKGVGTGLTLRGPRQTPHFPGSAGFKASVYSADKSQTWGSSSTTTRLR